MSPAFPEIDRAALGLFAEALFRYADPGGYVACRTFRDNADGAWRPDLWSAPQIEERELGAVITAAGELAAAAAAPEKVVFAPPVATFKTANGAAEKDICNGLDLTVECDEGPRQRASGSKA